MKPMLFSTVSSRKLALQSESNISKISYKSAYYQPSVNSLLLFMESSGKDPDKHFKDCITLYNRLLETKDVSDQSKNTIQNIVRSKLINVKDLDSAYNLLENCVDKDLCVTCHSRIELLENCDRVLRNEAKLLKRFDLNKMINDNILRGTRHTVFELCSLLDTYNISSKAKLNIALENVSYALFKSGHDIDLNEATEYIVEYFFTRDAVITDKEYKGYIDVLENNAFINKESENIEYIFDADENGYNSFTTKLMDMSDKCDDPQYKIHIRKALTIRNEKDASQYIDDTILFILDDNTNTNDATLLFNSIYGIPLIGNVSEEFINYKMELSKKKIEIKQKLSNSNQDFIKEALNHGSLLTFAELISAAVHYENYILDDYYKDETDPVKILEGTNDDKMIKDIIDSFKASNEKSPSKFKNMITRIMTKSPKNIIEETPSIFTIARMMLYLGVAGAVPLGPVFGGILLLVDTLLSRHLNIKEAEKFLRYLRNEKKNAEKKLESSSDKEKDNQKEYIDCLNKCIKKVEKYITDMDDENEEVQNSGDDEFDFGDFDFDLEAALESGSLVSNEIPHDLLDMISKDTDVEILSNLATLFDNSYYAAEFYRTVKNVNESGKFDYILDSEGFDRITFEDDELSISAQYEATQILKDILTEAKVNEKDKKKDRFNLNTLKMATVNFRQKFKEISGKEKEFWRNIDIATVQLTKGIQQALTSDRREAIIKGSIIPSFSKCIKGVMTIAAAGVIGSFSGVGIVYSAITAVGMLGASKILNERERRLLYDEIDTELTVVEKQIQLAENEGDMNQYRFLLNYQKKLTREKQRIKYGIHMSGRTIPEIRKGRD